jgi:TIR domain-containing protein
MPNIALSYRRSDSLAITGRICDRLIARYGKASVFMDIDDIPVGIDFRTHIQEVWRHTDVVVAVIGAHWLGTDAAGASRFEQESDPVRAEIESAIALDVPLIPVLIDGTKMPSATALPESFGNFVYRNAAEVSSGRDFHQHVDRLIAQIEDILAKRAAEASGKVSQAASGGTRGRVAAATSRSTDLVRYLVVPLVILLVAHHVIVNALDLDFEYLRAVSIALPFCFGFALLWLGKRGIGLAVAIAAALGIVAVAGMTVSEGLNSGQPILPQTRFEWKDNIEYAATISLSFIAGHALARALVTALSRRMRRTS